MQITIIGLGYVGLPLAVEFSKKFPTIGYDIDLKRINDLNKFIDVTQEIDIEILKEVKAENIQQLEEFNKGLFFTSELAQIESSNVYIITVPTPTDKHKRPVLTPLIEASKSVGKVLSVGDYVIYESTVYPGVTEDECVPVLEEISGLRFNKDFFVGYSPERINPGDKNRPLKSIVKVTSGSTEEASRVIDGLYNEIIEAGTFKAESIKVAEASKVIENSQRDINIAFVNELAKIFNKLNIDTQAVLEAAGTKWNFLKYTPGLVGGHCIGVDPYYLAQKAQESGYYPEIILAGRRINDSMGSFVASQIVKSMIQKNISVKSAECLILGFTFKENCPDVRNTRVIDIYKDLIDFGLNVCVHDPEADTVEVKNEYGINLINDLDLFSKKYSVIILAVAHRSFLNLDFNKLRDSCSLLYDIKGFLPKNIIDARL